MRRLLENPQTWIAVAMLIGAIVMIGRNDQKLNHVIDAVDNLAQTQAADHDSIVAIEAYLVHQAGDGYRPTR